MKFSGKIEDGTSNKPLNFSSKLLTCLRFALSECTSPSEDLHSLSASSLLFFFLCIMDSIATLLSKLKTFTFARAFK